MPSHKKHHFVPKFYLKRFSEDQKSISLFNINSKKFIKNGKLKTQCYKDYFYGKDPTLEHALGQIEGSSGEVLTRIEQGRLSSEDYIKFVLYIAMQHGRTVSASEALNEITDKFFKHLTKHRFKDIGANPEKFTFINNNASQFSVTTAVLSHFLLLDLGISIVRAQGKDSFITSDSPVVHYNSLFESDRLGSNEGVACKGLLIFFPISPTTTVVLYDKDVYAVGGKRGIEVTDPTPSDILQLNGLQFVSAEENIYYSAYFSGIFEINSRYLCHRPKRRSRLNVFLEKGKNNERSEIVAMSNEDIKINLDISFIRTTKKARKWKAGLDSQTSRPALIVRNEAMVDAHREFVKRVQNGEFQPTDFPVWCSKKGVDFPL